MKTILILLALLVSSSILVTTTTESNSETTTATSIAQLSKLKMVKSVILSNQGLEKLPSELKNHKEIEKLVVANNYITTLPDFVKELNQLRYLDLSKNMTIDLDQSLEQLKGIKLESLNLSECGLAYIPFKIGKIKSLKRLDLSNNHLIDIPFYLGKLKKLESLDLSNNELKSLDYGVWKCKNLKHLNLSGMRGLDMKNICMNMQTLKQLQSVSISYVNDTLPEEFGLVNTRQWMIDNSVLSYMPSTIESNPVVEEISFESCESTEFETISSSLGKIQNLKKLRISNSISAIPSGLEEIDQITSLDLSHNKLTSLPISEKDFPNLTELVLYGNDFSEEEWKKIQAAFPNCTIMSNNTPKASSEVVVSKNGTTVQPPLPQISLPINQKKISTDVSNVLNFNGTEIKIPKDAFVDKNGNKVTGPVTLKYAQFDDPLEIFLSGIPMKYDSADVSTYFQSAGMFDISATSNGEEVFLDQGKEIELNFASNSTEDGYSLYSLDSESGQWSNEGGTKLDPNAIQGNYDYFMLPGTMRLPAKPSLSLPEIGVAVVKNKGRHYFEINDKHDSYLKGEQLNYPKTLINSKYNLVPLYEKDARKVKKELKKYYAHGRNYTGTKVAIDVTFHPSENNDYFVLSILHPDTLLEIPMKLEFFRNSFEKEQKYYKTFWKKYSKSVDKEKDSNEDKIAKYEKKLADYEAALKDYEDLQRDYYENHKYEYAARSIVISKMGTWNCDRIPRMDKPEALALKFKGIGDGDFNPKAVTILDYTDVGTMYFLAKDITIESKNKIGVMAFDKDKCAFISPKEFSELRKNSSGKQITAEVEVLDATELTEEAIKSLMN